MKDPKGSQSHPLRIHHTDELRHCLLQTCGCCLWHAEAQLCCSMMLWESGGTRVLWECCHPTSTQGSPCSVCGSLGAVRTGIMGAACSLPLVPHGDPGHRTLAHRGPCRAQGTVGTRPAPPCFPPPIRDPRAAPAPSANQSLVPILFTANPRGRWGIGQHGCFPASQSAPGCARGEGGAGPHGGRGTAPSRRGRL